MVWWIYRCYRRSNGGNDIVPLLMKLTARGRANARRAMEHLQQKDAQWWERPHASHIRGENHIYMIRFRDENRTQWRILGFHEHAMSVFVLTNTATEKDGDYEPATYGSIASERRKECLADWDRRVCSCLASISSMAALAPANAG